MCEFVCVCMCLCVWVGGWVFVCVGGGEGGASVCETERGGGEGTDRQPDKQTDRQLWISKKPCP